MTKIHRVRWRFEDQPEHRKFIADKLIGLKNALESEVRNTTDESSLRLATWNIMHFGNGGAYNRSEESMLYIAEIIDHFDLVAIQEVNRDLRKFHALMEDYLGSEWDYIVTDTTEGATGNNERLAFVFRKNKIRFTKEVGEIVLPKGQRIAGAEEQQEHANDTQAATDNDRHVQFARTPFSVSFQADWLKFKISTVHIYYGSKKKNPDFMDQRRDEIDRIAQFLKERHDAETEAAIDAAKEDGWADPDEAGWAVNHILLGDFNIISPEHETMEALERDDRFTVATKPLRTNLGGDKHYDQIAFRAGNPDFSVIKTGVFTMFDHIYRDLDADYYAKLPSLREALVERRSGDDRTPEEAAQYFQSYYRKHQISDHKLLWCEIGIDYSKKYLGRILTE